MPDNKSNESRRKLLKSIAAGSGAVIAGKSLPESWSRPVVDSVILPVHAQTSPSTPPNPGTPPITPTTLTPLTFLLDTDGSDTGLSCGATLSSAVLYRGRLQITPNPGAGQTVQYQLGGGDPIQNTSTDANGIAEAIFGNVIGFDLIWTYQGLNTTCTVNV